MMTPTPPRRNRAAAAGVEASIKRYFRPTSIDAETSTSDGEREGEGEGEDGSVVRKRRRDEEDGGG